ncbi:MAG: AAA family ATPase [Planctomycetes bacterium]|nr:AAA family ATPase [Planctomycetota bacterium]
MNDRPTYTLSDLIAELSRPAAYPFPVDEVEIRQTHISAVFLAGDHVFKVKKPVRLPFLDFSTLELRKFYCEEEVRLNRRLAPDVYRGVVPIHATAAGLRIGDGDGPIVEWAVQMVRLPEEATFLSRLECESLSEAQVEQLAQRIADFHRAALIPMTDPAISAKVSAGGTFDRITTAVRDNLQFAHKQVGHTISAVNYQRLKDATELSLDQLRPLIERRVTERMIRDLHGDLHLDHVYLFDDRPPPSDLVVIDCIEFNESFRFIDVVADIAFCTMDFLFHGRRDLARRFSQTYFAATADTEGRELLPFYTAYRAAVRAKVDGITAAEPEIPQSQRDAATQRSTAHWLLALGELAPPDNRPLLLLVSGLPGTGKSTLARELVADGSWVWIRSDEVRKELAASAGVTPTTNRGDYLSGIYTPEWTDRTYAECLRRAQSALWNGQRVIVDATFLEESRRIRFLTAAVELGVTAFWLVCEASPDVVRVRLEARRNDVSDADWSIYQKAAAVWQKPGVVTQRALITIDANPGPQAMAGKALAAILNKLAMD